MSKNLHNGLLLGMGVFKTGFTQTDKFNESMQGLARFTFNSNFCPTKLRIFWWGSWVNLMDT